MVKFIGLGDYIIACDNIKYIQKIREFKSDAYKIHLKTNEILTVYDYDMNNTNNIGGLCLVDYLNKNNDNE